MDLQNLDIVAAASEASDMPLLNPHTFEETGIVLQVLGYDSDPVVAAGRKFGQWAMSRRSKLSPDQLIRKKSVMLAKAAVVGLGKRAPEKEGEEPLDSEPLVMKGKEIKVPSKEFNELLEDPGFIWIAQQVERHGDDRGNYSPDLPTD